MTKQITSRQFFQFCNVIPNGPLSDASAMQTWAYGGKSEMDSLPLPTAGELVKPWAYIYDMRCKWCNRKSAKGSLFSFRENKAKST